VALRHHVVGRYTSLVAVDVTPARPGDKSLAQAALKTNLPQGEDYTAIFGLPGTATPATLQVVAGLLFFLLAAAL
jgi:Ca-activated chloride channel family protein